MASVGLDVYFEIADAVGLATPDTTALRALLIAGRVIDDPEISRRRAGREETVRILEIIAEMTPAERAALAKRVRH